MKKVILGLLMLSSVSSVFASEHCERMNPYSPLHQTIWSALSELGALGDLSLPISGGVLVNNLWQIQLHEKSGEDYIAAGLHELLTAKYGANSNSGENEVKDAMDQSIKNDETVCDLTKRLAEKYTFQGE